MTGHDPAANDPHDEGHADSERAKAGGVTAPAEIRSAAANKQEPAPMLEAHLPNEAIQTWRGFFVHIATIVIGLIIAVALEQTVEFFHHRHQRLLLEEQIRAVLNDDTELVSADTAKLAGFRAYLVDLQSAVIARRHGQATAALPAVDDPRMAITIGLPSLAPYEAAKDNGTIALLSSQRIRLYNRVAFQREMLKTVYANWFEDLAAIGAFKRRFDYSANNSGPSVVQVDVGVLSPAELAEYQSLIGRLINRIEWMDMRLRVFGAQCRAILEGVRDENEMFIRANPSTVGAIDNSPSTGQR